MKLFYKRGWWLKMIDFELELMLKFSQITELVS